MKLGPCVACGDGSTPTSPLPASFHHHHISPSSPPPLHSSIFIFKHSESDVTGADLERSFMGLPPELRIPIYEELLLFNDDEPGKTLHPQVLSVSKTFNREASAIWDQQMKETARKNQTGLRACFCPLWPGRRGTNSPTRSHYTGTCALESGVSTIVSTCGHRFDVLEAVRIHLHALPYATVTWRHTSRLQPR